jgi:hypothetical protein
MSRILVVANQTIGGSDLLQSIRDRMTKGPCEFTLLVPATAQTHRDSTMQMLGRRLGVPGHKVGDSRLVGGRPPSAVCRRRVL